MLKTKDCLMQFPFIYDKKKVIQALRIHFTAQKEIKILLIVVNVFAIISAILFYTHKIQPQPFLLGSLIWLLLLIGVWYILPYSIYKKSTTFKDEFIAYINIAKRDHAHRTTNSCGTFHNGYRHDRLNGTFM